MKVWFFMEVKAISRGDAMWDNVMDYCEKCSWKAGPFLAKKMRYSSFEEWEKVFVLTDKKQIMGYCTFTKTDFSENSKYIPYIGFLFIDEKQRGRRLSQYLIESVLSYAKVCGFSEAFLTSEERGLYEKYGFEKIEEVKKTSGNYEQLFSSKL